MRKLAVFAGAAALLAACAGPARPPVPVIPPPPGGEVPPPVVSTSPAAAILWTPPSSQEALAAAEFLQAHPEMRVTALFPEWFFGEDENGRKAKALFADMVSKGRVEVVLTLPSRPVLALIHDSDLARLSTTTAAAPLPPRFRRPEDVADQIVLARSAYRRRWKTAPAGLAIPWGAVAGPELESAAKGLRWFYAGAAPASGACNGGGLPVVTAAPFPSKPDAAARKNWFRARQPGDTIQAASLDDLAALAPLMAGAGLRWAPVAELAKDAPAPEANCPPSDFSPWIGEPEVNKAWQLLSIARQSVEDFKNSGRADLQTLNRALRELYSAEGGGVFYALGAKGSPLRMAEVKREFMATLEQIYRLMGLTPPASLRQGFSGNATPEGPETTGAGDPFFRREGNTLVWRDSAKDDRGPGNFFYPTGSGFPTGAWDLVSFRVEPREADVVFQWRLSALANPGQAPYGFSVELLDTYVDINHLPGAGTEQLLPGRPGLVEPQNAWEYALSVDGWGARFYQQWAGGGPRRVAVLPVKLIPPSTLEVAVPRKYLRGEPDGWGLAVAVMGRSADSAAGSEPQPMKVLDQSGPDNFGGAGKGGSAPPFVDLLSDGDAQNEILNGYKQGRDPVLPFVRAEN
jgi:hypothetical protein